MGRNATRFVGVLIGLTLALCLPPPAAMAADKLPLAGSLDVTTVGATINIDLAYRANAPITRFAVSLTGPSFDDVLFETVDLPAEVTWSGSATDLVAGTYTVTVSAEIQRNGKRTSGSATRSIEVGGVPALPKPVAAGAGEPLLAAEAAPPAPGDVIADIVVYGATPSGVIAAVSASRPGARIVVVEATEHVGGMMSNGLTATDYGHTALLRRTHQGVLRPHAGGGGLGLRALPVPALDRRTGLRGHACRRRHPGREGGSARREWRGDQGRSAHSVDPVGVRSEPLGKGVHRRQL